MMDTKVRLPASSGVRAGAEGLLGVWGGCCWGAGGEGGLACIAGQCCEKMSGRQNVLRCTKERNESAKALRHRGSSQPASKKREEPSSG